MPKIDPSTAPESKASVKNGHCLQSRSTVEALILTVGSRDNMAFHSGRYAGNGSYTKKDGTPIR